TLDANCSSHASRQRSQSERTESISRCWVPSPANNVRISSGISPNYFVSTRRSAKANLFRIYLEAINPGGVCASSVSDIGRSEYLCSDSERVVGNPSLIR